MRFRSVPLATAALVLAPTLAPAVDINVNVGSVRVEGPGGVSVTFGSRNDRGYYWDGYEWRDPERSLAKSWSAGAS